MVIIFLMLSYIISHYLNATVCIIKSFLCHNIKQTNIMEFYVIWYVACHDHHGIPTHMQQGEL